MMLRRHGFSVTVTTLCLAWWFSCTSIISNTSSSSSPFANAEYFDYITESLSNVYDSATSTWEDLDFDLSRATDALKVVDITWDDDIELTTTEKTLSALSSVSCTLYGTALLLRSAHFPGQIHLLTMFRSTGFDKLQTMAATAKRNIRDAVLSVVWHSPNFVQAALSVKNMQGRVAEAKSILRDNRLARADGLVTPKEAAALQKRKRAEIAKYQSDMKHLLRAGSSLGKVWKALDFDELMDLLRGFLFQMMAVLASGHNTSMIGKVVFKWCLFVNLGTLFLDTNQKLRYPLARAVHGSQWTDVVSIRQEKALERTAEIIMFSSAGYLVLAHNATALHVNAAMVSAAVIFRGLRQLVETFWDRDGDGMFLWAALGNLLEGWTGGVFMIVLTIIGLTSRLLSIREQEANTNSKKNKQDAPSWLLSPFRGVEATIDKLVVVLDKIV